MRTKASGHPSWPGVTDSTEAEYIGADQLPFFVFRLQLCGGPYMPITPFERSRPAADASREVKVGLVACGLR